MSGYEARTPRGWSPSHRSDAAEFWTALRSCLAELPTPMHEAFALRYLEDAAAPEVCTTLGVTAANYWALLHRARLRLCTCLSLQGYGGNAGKGQRS